MANERRTMRVGESLQMIYDADDNYIYDPLYYVRAGHESASAPAFLVSGGARPRFILIYYSIEISDIYIYAILDSQWNRLNRGIKYHADWIPLVWITWSRRRFLRSSIWRFLQDHRIVNRLMILRKYEYYLLLERLFNKVSGVRAILAA